MQGNPYMDPVGRWVESMGITVKRGGGSDDEGSTEMLRRVIEEDENSIILAVDGPYGPLYKFKSGAVVLAKQTGAPIVHCFYRTSKARDDEARWDRRLVPRPFDSIDVYLGKERFVGEDEDVEAVVEELERNWDGRRP
jgi:lysophospholipid acyltransferase (LPLAT)-like uncharacterized protein